MKIVFVMMAIVSWSGAAVSIAHGQVIYTPQDVARSYANALQREANAAYAQDLAAQGNARRTEEDARNGDALATDLMRAPRSGFEAYCQRRFGQEPGERRWLNGSKRWEIRPWNAAERTQKITQFREEYARLPEGEKQRWERRVGNADLQTQPARQPTTPRSSSLEEFIAKLDQGFTTENEARSFAIKRHPDLAVAGTDFNRRFVAHLQSLRRSDPAGILKHPSWPVFLSIVTETDIREGR